MSTIHLDLDSQTASELKERAAEMGFGAAQYAEMALKHVLREQMLPYKRRLLPADEPAHERRPRFIDLFAGIGGFRLAFEKQGAKCVFSSEWDRWSRITYFENHGEIPEGDIREIAPSDIPDHEILTAGFPCQPFSLAGVSKKTSLGRAHGFKDAAQGTLFFDVANIIEAKRPAMFLLENVKNLKSHDKGQTYRVIRGTLDELGYEVFDKVIDARSYVPQHRERVFIVGFDRERFGSEIEFDFPDTPDSSPTLGQILDPSVDKKYVLSDHLWKYLRDYADKHREKGNGFGFGLFGPQGVARTLSARYHKDGSEILIDRGRGNPRRLTPRECARLMGYPDTFRIPVSDTQAYRQFGNSVVVPVVTDIAAAMIETYHILTNTENGAIGNGRRVEGEAERDDVGNPREGHPVRGTRPKHAVQGRLSFSKK